MFLIDDLDRCLPEKAVEMLEAIKLFLDIEGCVFVLAVDDEVVERGIAHRYRDYLGVGDRSADSVAYSLKPERFREYRSQFAGGGVSGSAPITGHEYLEKIIQLPIRLPRFSREQARQLLLDTATRLKSPELFAPSSAHPGREANEWLLDLFLDATPPSPRKLIRAVELLDFVHRLARYQKRLEELQPYTLAQLVLLQCFAPQMFRDLARRRAAAWKRFSERIEEADAARIAIASPSFLTWWEGRITLDKSQGDPGIVKRAEVIEEPFVVQLRQAIGFRSGFDPRNLFLSGYIVDDDLTPYFNVFAEKHVTVPIPSVAPPAPAGAAPAAPTASVTIAGSPVSPIMAPAGGVSAGDASDRQVADLLQDIASHSPVLAAKTVSEERPAIPQLLSASPRQPTVFVDLLMAPDTATRIGAIRDEPSLAGRVLDSRTVGLILERVKASPGAVTAGWLATIGDHLSDDALAQIIRVSGALSRLTEQPDFASADELGRLLEWVCLRMRPWHTDDRSPISLDTLGLSRELDSHRSEWSYRYLRGIRDETVTPEEPLEIWPAYAASVESPVVTIVEIAPGRLAMATVNGEIGIWSRSLRGTWQMDGKLMSCGTADVLISPIGTLDVATHVRGQGFSLWQQQPTRWHRRYLATDFADAVLLTAMSADVVAICPTDRTVRVGVDSHDVPRGSRWQFFDCTFQLPIQSLVRVSNTEVLVVAGGADILEAKATVGLIVGHVPAAGDVFVDGARVGDLMLLVNANGGVQTWTRHDREFTQKKALNSMIPSVVAVRSSGPLALLLARDGNCELWDCRNADAPERIGGGSIGTAPHRGVCLLRDGSVLVTTPTAVQRFAINHSSGKFEFSETVVSVDPTPTLPLSAPAVRMTLARGGMIFSMRDGNPGACEAASSGVNNVIAAVPVKPDGMAVIGTSRSAAFHMNGLIKSVVPFEEEPRCLATFDDAVAVGTTGPILFLSNASGTWAVESRQDNFGELNGLVSDGQSTGLAWSTTAVQLVRRHAKYNVNEHRYWALPPGELLRSIVAVTPQQLRTYGNAPSRFLGCSDRSL